MQSLLQRFCFGRCDVGQGVLQLLSYSLRKEQGWNRWEAATSRTPGNPHIVRQSACATYPAGRQGCLIVEDDNRLCPSACQVVGFQREGCKFTIDTSSVYQRDLAWWRPLLALAGRSNHAIGIGVIKHQTSADSVSRLLCIPYSTLGINHAGLREPPSCDCDLLQVLLLGLLRLDVCSCRRLHTPHPIKPLFIKLDHDNIWSASGDHRLHVPWSPWGYVQSRNQDDLLAVLVGITSGVRQLVAGHCQRSLPKVGSVDPPCHHTSYEQSAHDQEEGRGQTENAMVAAI
mmetsp:Transcript_63219/g.150773  ORF Transcript_63219/g.150773 Transcript_63219/m.150773 type:complete len:287 (-) Transcript_63219:516-1376(-)